MQSKKGAQALQEYRKIKRIISEMMDYFYNHGGESLEVGLELNQYESVFFVAAYLDALPEDLEEMMEAFQSPRQMEYDDHYVDLLGLREDKIDIDVVASMIDWSTYSYEKGKLKISMVRFR